MVFNSIEPFLDRLPLYIVLLNFENSFLPFGKRRSRRSDDHSRVKNMEKEGEKFYRKEEKKIGGKKKGEDEREEREIGRTKEVKGEEKDDI